VSAFPQLLSLEWGSKRLSSNTVSAPDLFAPFFSISSFWQLHAKWNLFVLRFLFPPFPSLPEIPLTTRGIPLVFFGPPPRPPPPPQGTGDSLHPMEPVLLSSVFLGLKTSTVNRRRSLSGFPPPPYLHHVYSNNFSPLRLQHSLLRAFYLPSRPQSVSIVLAAILADVDH